MLKNDLVLKICRLPKNIDEEIEMYVKDILFCIIIVHLLFAIWIYGDSKIFPEVFFYNFAYFCNYLYTIK